MPAPIIGAGLPFLRRGGARPRRAVSDALAPGVSLRLAAAASASVAAGLPLNALVTVHWGARGLDDREAGRATQDFIRRARDWARDNGSPWLALWVREGDIGDQHKGPHLHLLVHLSGPRSAAFARGFARWARLAAGSGPVRGAVHTRRIGGRVNAWVGTSDHFRANLRATVSYVLKGSEPDGAAEASEALCAIWAGSDATTVKSGLGGRVWGRRAGISRALTRLVNDSCPSKCTSRA